MKIAESFLVVTGGRHWRLRSRTCNFLLFCCILLLVCATATADEKRYVVQTKLAGRILTEYILWTTAGWADSCARATIGGTKQDVKTFCEEGFSGLKPRVGIVSAGVEVELLPAGECKKMAYIRVLSGPLSGEVGCIDSSALSSVPPK